MEHGSVPAPWRVIVATELVFISQAFQQALAQRGHKVVALLTSAKRDPHYIEVVRAAPQGVDVIVSSHPKRWAAMLAPLRPDLIITANFGFRIPADVIALPRLGAINFHPTPLPAYRGTDVPFWMLRHGVRDWGLTMHRMSTEFDTGPILAQATFEISDDDNLVTIIPMLMGAIDQLWDTGLARIAAGDPGDPQDESRASYFGRVPDVDAWSRIDWSMPAREIHNLVRSCVGFRELMGGVGTLDGVPMTISRTQLITDPGKNGQVAPPGTVLCRDNGTIVVQCGDGPLRIVEYTPIS